MMSNREIVTLQFGTYSNYIGAHWWNIQESGFSYDSKSSPSEINHDVLYREGTNLDNQKTYTPRLMLVELDGALKHLPRHGELYGNNIKRRINTGDDVEEDPVKKLREDLERQETNVEVMEEPMANKHDFQSDLDNPEVDITMKDYKLVDNVVSWTDFLYARYHPRTVHVIKQYQYASDKETFDTYSNGVTVWETPEFEDDFCDNIRQYVEECDFMQGFQLIFDSFNGHCGIATQCLEYLNDEYSRTTFAIPVFSPKNLLYENADEAMSDSIRSINSALSFHQLIEHASLFVPLSTQDRVWRQLGSPRDMPGLKYQGDNLYQTSSILAAYLDTISLRYRLKDSPSTSSLPGFCNDLNNYGRKLAGAGFAFPFPMKHDEDLIDCLDKFQGELFTQLTPSCSIGKDYVIQSLCVRGIPRERLKRPREEAQQQMRMASYKCKSVSEMLQLYLQCENHASMSHVSSIEAPLPTRIPFPCEMFEGKLNTNGFLSDVAERAPSEKVNSVPALASLQSSSGLADTVDTLYREAKRVKVPKLHRFKEAGLEDDDYLDSLENLLLFKSSYEDHFHL